MKKYKSVYRSLKYSDLNEGVASFGTDCSLCHAVKSSILTSTLQISFNFFFAFFCLDYLYVENLETWMFCVFVHVCPVMKSMLIIPSFGICVHTTILHFLKPNWTTSWIISLLCLPSSVSKESLGFHLNLVHESVSARTETKPRAWV